MKSDIPIFLGILALIVFGHACFNYNPAQAAGFTRLLLQGAGAGYMVDSSNDRATDLEYNARRVLAQLGSAQISYSLDHGDDTYAWLHNLIREGYLAPNESGGTLVNSYSITFYLPSARGGFTLVAESRNLDLRSFLITENQDVVPLTPTVIENPNDDWATVRAMEETLYYDYGGYDYLNSLFLYSYNPPLGLRLNLEKTGYILFAYKEEDEILVPDDELIYIDNLSSFMIGDTRSGH